MSRIALLPRFFSHVPGGLRERREGERENGRRKRVRKTTAGRRSCLPWKAWSWTFLLWKSCLAAVNREKDVFRLKSF